MVLTSTHYYIYILFEFLCQFVDKKPIRPILSEAECTYIECKWNIIVQIWPVHYDQRCYTVRSRPEAQRTRSLQKCFSRIFTWFHWIRLFNDIIYYINSPFVLSVLVESSRCSSKSLQKESRPLRLWTRPYGIKAGRICHTSGHYIVRSYNAQE